MCIFCWNWERRNNWTLIELQVSIGNLDCLLLGIGTGPSLFHEDFCLIFACCVSPRPASRSAELWNRRPRLRLEFAETVQLFSIPPPCVCRKFNQRAGGSNKRDNNRNTGIQVCWWVGRKDLDELFVMYLQTQFRHCKFHLATHLTSAAGATLQSRRALTLSIRNTYTRCGRIISSDKEK